MKFRSLQLQKPFMLYSALFLLTTTTALSGCLFLAAISPVSGRDAGDTKDGGPANDDVDSGDVDAGPNDAGLLDGGVLDSGSFDASDGGPVDGGCPAMPDSGAACNTDLDCSEAEACLSGACVESIPCAVDNPSCTQDQICLDSEKCGDVHQGQPGFSLQLQPTTPLIGLPFLVIAQGPLISTLDVKLIGNAENIFNTSLRTGANAANTVMVYDVTQASLENGSESYAIALQGDCPPALALTHFRILGAQERECDFELECNEGEQCMRPLDSSPGSSCGLKSDCRFCSSTEICGFQNTCMPIKQRGESFLLTSTSPVPNPDGGTSFESIELELSMAYDGTQTNVILEGTDANGFLDVRRRANNFYIEDGPEGNRRQRYYYIIPKSLVGNPRFVFSRTYADGGTAETIEVFYLFNL